MAGDVTGRSEARSNARATYRWGISDLPLIPTGYERLLPPTAQMIVHTRRREAAARTAGRVLDLGGAASHLTMHRGVAPDEITVLDAPDQVIRASLEMEDGSVDHVISICALTRVADLDGVLATIGRLLAPDGRLHFVEPIPTVGRFSSLVRLSSPVVAATSGLRLDRNVVEAMRSADLTICELHRERVAALRVPFQHLAWGSARPSRPT